MMWPSRMRRRDDGPESRTPASSSPSVADSSSAIDQWAYVPFDVPAGTQRIDVSTSHDQFSLLGIGRNVLDLGIFGPAGHELGNAEGFRGWSGGARAGFMLSAVNATPGYLAGPIDPGRWALALGPVVLNPLGMDWQRPDHARPGACSRRCGRSPDVRPGRPPQSVNRVGIAATYTRTQCIPMAGGGSPRWPTAATSAGLDFIVSTDHNTSSANRAWAATTAMAWRSSRVRRSPPATGIGWRSGCLPAAGSTGGTHRATASLPAYAARVRADGGLVVAAHPSVPLPGCAWEFGYHDVDAMEVWNGLWNVDDELSLRIWQQLLRQGRRITAVGGSDSHVPSQPVGRPQTVVYARGTVDGRPDRRSEARSLLRGRVKRCDVGAQRISRRRRGDGRTRRDADRASWCRGDSNRRSERRARRQHRPHHRRRLRRPREDRRIRGRAD